MFDTLQKQQQFYIIVVLKEKVFGKYILVQYALYLISLWFPSMCQRDNEPGTQYFLLRIDCLHRSCTPLGSVLINDCLTLSHCNRMPLPRRYPFSILKPIPQCIACTSLTIASSSSLVSLLYVPESDLNLSFIIYK